MSKILIITTEFISFEGSPTGGRGVRIETLAQGLTEHGHSVVFSFLVDNYHKLKNKPPQNLIEYLHNYYYDDIIEKVKPDIIIFSPWTLLLGLKNEDIINKYFIGADLNGSLLLENTFSKEIDDLPFTSKKIAALNKADFFLCSNDRQKYYVMSWLFLSGQSLEKDMIIICPPSCNLADNSKRTYPQIPEYIFGGVLWHWQDYGENLKIIAEYLDSQGGILKIFCDSFIYSNENKKLEYLDKYKSVRQYGLIAYDELMKHYQTASVAVELYILNTERLLATTTRTAAYFANALPVIYTEQMYFAAIIKDYDAGWVIDSKNKNALLRVLEEINANPQICAIKGKNAQNIILEKLNNKIATQSLSVYCNNPFKTKKTKNYFIFSADTIYNQSEIILKFQKKAEIEKSKYQEELKLRDELIKQKETEINFLNADLTRIKSRIVFKLLLKIKKILNFVFGKF